MVAAAVVDARRQAIVDPLPLEPTEDAPPPNRIAHCLRCGRELRDPKSVAVEMGRTCIKKANL